MTSQGGHHVHLQREPGRRRIKPGADDPDHAGLLQPADPVQGRGGGKAHLASQLQVGAVRIGLQQVEQLNVNFIKFNGHVTEY